MPSYLSGMGKSGTNYGKQAGGRENVRIVRFQRKRSGISFLLLGVFFKIPPSKGKSNSRKSRSVPGKGIKRNILGSREHAGKQKTVVRHS